MKGVNMRADDWCDDCHSYGHATWCPAYKTKVEEENPKGFKCECGQFHMFDSYVMAHWDLKLTHECWNCRRKHVVQRGAATLV